MHQDPLIVHLQAFMDSWSPRQQAAAHSTVGRHIDSWLQLADRTIPAPSPDPSVMALLTRVDRTWPASSPRLIAALEQALRDPLLIAGNHARGWILNPVRLCQWMQSAGIDSVAGWCEHRHPSDPHEGARELLRFWSAGAEDRSRLTADQPRSWPHRAAAFELALPEIDHHRIQRAGQTIRAFVIADLAMPAERCHPITRRFFDVPDPVGTGWACAQPLRLCCDDLRLVEIACAHLELPGPPDALLTWWADQVLEPMTAPPIDDLPFMSDPMHAIDEWRAFRDQLHRMNPAPLPTRALIDEWITHPVGPIADASTTELLTDRLATCLDAVPWTWVIGVANRTDTPAAIDRLLDSDIDWTDFDSPGEGSLPLWWWRALMLMGDAADETRRRLESMDSALVGLGRQPADTWFASFVSVRAGGEWLRQTSQNPLSSYSHGLQDAVAEAYGDVWSRADPFSIRRADPPSD